METNSPEPKKGSHFMTGMIAGIVLGGVLAYVYSSPDGKKKAKKFIEEASDVLKEVSDKAQDLGMSAQDIGQKAVELKDELSEQVRLAHEDTRQNPATSFAQNLKQRFFMKGGKKLNS
ncbi:MAG: hypothetical protein NUV98_05550 [Candidatus Roizmanbacteria bacterium]|nr:hypothetical protein [Candidatus Roizmanbacteria bacterium]